MSNVVTISAQAQYEAKLEEWGIDKKSATKYGVSLEEKKNLTFVPANPPDARSNVIGGIKIQYFDLDGRPMKAAQAGPAFHRYRYMFGKSGFVDLDKKCKYSQEPRTPPLPYFPNVVDWRAINEDPENEVYITEGEMKALKASIEGFPTIALGGVSSFRSLYKRGLAFLPQLEEINWYRRKVFIVYDSDISEKVEVVRAMNDLGVQLYNRGALCHAIFLPGIPSQNEAGQDVELKCGFDDFLVQYGKEAFEQLDSVPIMGAKPLIDMNANFCYVQELNMAVELKNMYQNKVDASFATRFANIEYYNFMVVQEGEVEAKRANIVKSWLQWPSRNNVHNLSYDPGEKRYIEKDGRTLLNMWQGWGCESEPGNVKPFIKLMDFLFKNETKENVAWMWKWLAYPVKYPGVKLSSCVVIHSVGQGTGKTLLGELMGHVYGSNFLTIGQSHLQSDFTKWIDSKQFILGDEISGTGTADARKVADRLKGYITGKTIEVNQKFLHPYTIDNHVNFLFTSNHPDAFFIENSDRRYFIVEAPNQPESSAFYKEIADWRDNGGAKHLRHYLEQLDVSGFNPYGHAPMTEAKEQMISMSRGDLGQWVDDLVNSDVPIMVGKAVCNSELWTTQQLTLLYDPTGDKRISQKAMAMELRKCGAIPIMNQHQIKLSDRSQVRLWAIRNLVKWGKTGNNVSMKLASEHYERYFLVKNVRSDSDTK